ncbi:MAG: hypothetical protein GEU79_06000 [Acidimicrobiia bacterium]|nr:hypothetical protein [Acidimicrobiia bacterium]
MTCKGRQLLAVAFLLILPGVVSAQGSGSALVDELIASLSTERFHVDDGIGVPEEQLEELTGTHPRTWYVALGEAPPQGASDLAASLIEGSSAGTVVIITPTEMGAASRDHDPEEVREALVTALGDSTESELGDFTAFSEHLGVGVGPASTWSVVAVAVVGFLLLGLVGRTLLSRRPESGVARRLEERRAELRQRLTYLADDMSSVSGEIGENEIAGEHYKRANELLVGAEADLAGAASKADCDDLKDQLDVIRRELDSAVALLSDGSTSAPAGSACFFDPTHGAGTVPATLVGTDEAVISVWICSRDAESLLVGERPAPRMMTVGGKLLPAPIAPRTHGGGGLSGLDTFTIAIEGMAAPARYRFAPGRGRRMRSNGTSRS